MTHRKITNTSASYTSMGWVHVRWNLHESQIGGLFSSYSCLLPPEVIDSILRLVNTPDLGPNTWDWRYS